MGRQRHKRHLQQEKPPVAQQNRECVTELELSDESATEDLGSPSPEYGALDFYDVEQRASERLQKVVSMIDEWLKT